MSGDTPSPDPLDALLQSLYGPPAVEEILRRDREFAQSLLARKLATREAVEACLREQREAARAGAKPVPRLRKLLIQKKILTATQVAQAAESVDSSPVDLPPGPGVARLGDYLCLEKVGSGGMGEVWKAWDTVLGRPVALKLLKAADPDELARFRREAELSAKLAHPHIAAIYGIGSEGGRPYLAMQYVEGRTLDKIPRKDRRLLVRHIRDAARAVEYAHRQGIIHRDLKPSNIMIGGDEQVFILDFGLARKIEGVEKVTASGIILGTPAYMSPEQARGAEIDLRSDVYGLGATLYELLSDRPPFPGRTVFEIIKRMEDEDPARLPVDRDLDAIVLKCLEKDPAKRYRSAGTLANDLDRYLKGEPVLARAPGVAYRLWKRLAKRKALAAAAAIAVLLGGAALFWVRRATSAEANALAGLRRQTQTALLAVLEVRRSGRTEHAKAFVDRTAEACREAMSLHPQSAEPHYRLGRMFRAVMDDVKALEEQNRALEKEPHYGPALYERGVLLSRKYRQRAEELVQAALAVEGRRLAGDGEVKPGSEVRRPDWRKLAEKDGRAKGLMNQMKSDLGKLEAGAEGLSAGERSCARGLMAWSERKDEEAVRLLGAAVAADPGLEEGHEALAGLHEERGRYEEAIRAWTAGHDKDRGYIPHLLGRGGARLSWGSEKIVRGENPSALYGEAIEDFGEALKQDPARAEAWRGRGSSRLNLASYKEDHGEFATKLFEEGLGDLDQALKRNPESAMTWRSRGLGRLNWGICRARSGEEPADQFREAIEDLNEALRRNPDDVETWVSRGFARSNVGMHQKIRGEDPTRVYQAAIEDFGEALKRNPDCLGAWQGRGFARVHTGTHRMLRGEDPSAPLRDAIHDFEAAIQRDAGDAMSWLGRGGARSSWGFYNQAHGEDPKLQWREAMEDLTEALRRNPEQPVAWQWRGDLRSNWGNYALRSGEEPTGHWRGAIEDLGQAVKRARFLDKGWGSLGGVHLMWAYYKVERGEDPTELFAKALENYARAIEINRRDSSNWHFQGSAYRRRGLWKASRKMDGSADFRAALESYREAVRLNGRLEATLRPHIEECLQRLATHGDF